MDPRRSRAALLPTLFLVCFIAAPCWGDLDLKNFSYHEQLDDNFRMSWNFNSTHIAFHVKVKTTGWVGFGISNHGDMYPGDVVTGWMDNGTVHFHDRHTTGRSTPRIDTQQDWHLDRFSREDDQYNTFTVVRKLDTCDPDHDLPIQGATSRIIYAYSDAVPQSDDVILYHGADTRGTKSILLLDPPPVDGNTNNIPADAITVEFAHSNYTIPDDDTTYACKLVKFPTLKDKHHLIRYEPYVEDGHEKLVHHILLYACSSHKEDEDLNFAYPCYDWPRPTDVDDRDCKAVMVAWGIGGTGFDYPPHVGHSMGMPEDPVYFKLEVHYDNVKMEADLVDSSGIRMFLTPTIREYDAGLLEIGANVDQALIIPPKMTDFMTRGFCSSDCIDKAVADGGDMHIFADFLHSHLLGRRMATRHVRDGVELPPVVKDDHYDFDYQETRLLPVERVVKKGDSLFMDCHYNSVGRDQLTFGGLGSREEMCLSFILYYPRNKLITCTTQPSYSVNGTFLYNGSPTDVFNYLSNLDWSQASNRQDFINIVSASDHNSRCRYWNSEQDVKAIPQLVFKEYEPEDKCERAGPGDAAIVSAIPDFVLVWSACLLSVLVCQRANQHNGILQ